MNNLTDGHNFAEWIMANATIRLVLNNTNKLYMLHITTNTGHVIRLTLTESDWVNYKEKNFKVLTKISEKQSEIGVFFQPLNNYDSNHYP